MASLRGLLARAFRHPSGALLFVQLLGVLLYPLMEAAPRGRTFFGAFGLVVLLAALRMVRRSPGATWIAAVVATPLAVCSVLYVLTPTRPLLVATAALDAAFYFYAAGSLIAYMLQDLEVTTDEFFAAGATFTLLAWAFAYLFVVCQAVNPGSFAAASPGSFRAVFNPLGERTWMELLFLSFTTLSGVGLSDIVPLVPMARALVMLEELTGVMYIAVVVSRLVALTTMRRGRDAT